ncbi:MAG TPA: hypothetical protein VHU91_00170 [Mycobacteriales bacterium]|jgi:hypothetical protein|nr:hypothetical protein [Mycobacteriales bacterium]
MSKAYKIMIATAGIALTVGVALAIPETASADAGYVRVTNPNASGGGYDQISGQYVTTNNLNPYHNGYGYPG